MSTADEVSQVRYDYKINRMIVDRPKPPQDEDEDAAPCCFVDYDENGRICWTWPTTYEGQE